MLASTKAAFALTFPSLIRPPGLPQHPHDKGMKTAGYSSYSCPALSVPAVNYRVQVLRWLVGKKLAATCITSVHFKPITMYFLSSYGLGWPLLHLIQGWIKEEMRPCWPYCTHHEAMLISEKCALCSELHHQSPFPERDAQCTPICSGQTCSAECASRCPPPKRQGG